VEQISLMKPKGQTEHEEGLLEYIEDIIGSNQYIPRIAEAHAVYETINEEYVQNLNRAKAVDKDREGLVVCCY
jgi:structural maintenance of chromosome 4